MKPRIVIWGAGEQAIVVADIIRQQNMYEIAGFLDNINPGRKGSGFECSTVLGGQEQLEILKRNEITNIIFGFGHCGQRLQLAEIARQKGFTLGTAVHPAAIVAPNVQIGPGTVIKAGAILDPTVKVGANILIGSAVTVAHGTTLEDGVRLSAGTDIAGRVRIGRGTWLGIGVSVTAGVKIGAGSLIGLGAAVITDIPSDSVAYGVPAKVMRKVRKNEV